MARGKSKVPGVALLNWAISEPSEMPWERIEDTLGKSFDDSERREIFECALEYASVSALHEQGALQQRLEEIRVELLKHSSDLIEIINRGLPASDRSALDRSRLDQEDLRAFDVLCNAYSADRWLREDLNELRSSAERVRSALGSAPETSMDPSGLMPHTAGLSAFILEALKDANAKNARSSPNSWNVPAREYTRWGVHIGPQSREFLAFSKAILGKEITQGQIERAFEKAKDQIRTKAKRAHDLGRSEVADAIEKHPLFFRDD